MGNIAQWAQSNPEAIKHWERTLGLPDDGSYDPELQQRIESYQLLLGQTPGQTKDGHEDGGAEWGALNQLLTDRANSNTNLSSDNAPMRDTAFQAFLRESGAQEAQLLDEIRYRTEQSTREVNRRAAGFEAERSEVKQNNEASLQAGTRNIKSDFENRGILQSSMQQEHTGRLAENINRQQSQQLGAIDENAMNFNVGQRDALATFARQARGDIAGLYRRRVDEEMNARDRVRLNDGQMKYPNG